MPTLRQIRDGKYPDAAKLKTRCKEIVAVVEKVLASPVYNTTLGVFASAACLRCQATIRKRMPPGVGSVEAKCFECGAEYQIKDVGGGQVEWKPMQEEIACPVDGCGVSVWLWRDQIRVGSRWTCESCGERIVIGMALGREAGPHETKGT